MSGLLTALQTTTIDSTQLKTLREMPIALVNAIEGFVIIPNRILLTYVFESIRYDISNVELVFTINKTDFVSLDVSNFMDQQQNKLILMQNISWPSLGVDEFIGQPFLLMSTGTEDLKNGDGHLIVNTFYSTSDLFY